MKFCVHDINIPIFLYRSNESCIFMCFMDIDGLDEEQVNEAMKLLRCISAIPQRIASFFF